MGSTCSPQFKLSQHHQTFGQIFIKTRQSLKQDNDLMIFYWPISTKQQLQKMSIKEKSIKQSQLKHYIFFPKNYFIQEKISLCRDQYLLKIQSEIYYNTLFEIIQQKKKHSQIFSQEELWKLLFISVKIGEFFQRKQQKIGNIHTKNILYKKLTHSTQIKFVTAYSLPLYYENQYNSLLEKHNLSPQQLQMNNKSYIQKEFNQASSDVYSLGLVLLQVGSLCYSQQFYKSMKKTEYTINQQNINKAFIRMQNNNYSNLLIQTIRQMLDKDCTLRNKCKYFYQKLQPYTQDILNGKPIKDIKGLGKIQFNAYSSDQTLRRSVQYEEANLRNTLNTVIR